MTTYNLKQVSRYLDCCMGLARIQQKIFAMPLDETSEMSDLEVRMCRGYLKRVEDIPEEFEGAHMMVKDVRTRLERFLNQK